MRTLSGLHLFNELKIERYFKKDNVLKKRMRELTNLETKILASVIDIPNISTFLKIEHNSTSKSRTDTKLEMLISDNNKNIRKAQQSPQVPKNRYSKKIKEKQ